MSKLDPNRPTVPQVKPLINKLREEHPGTGCCLHIYVEDGNCDNGHFDAAGRVAFIEQMYCGDPTHLELFDLLARMSVTQRLKVSRYD